jgi:ABC-type transporter Mla subunit MlaD
MQQTLDQILDSLIDDLARINQALSETNQTLREVRDGLGER